VLYSLAVEFSTLITIDIEAAPLIDHIKSKSSDPPDDDHVSQSLQTHVKSIHTHIGFGRLITLATNAKFTGVYIMSVMVPLTSALRPQTAGLVMDVSDGSLIAHSIGRARSTLDNVLHQNSRSFANVQYEKLDLPPKLVADLMSQVILTATQSSAYIVQGGLLLARSQDRAVSLPS
jgi:hypothetical protein